jgi:hypothetical protein
VTCWLASFNVIVTLVFGVNIVYTRLSYNIYIKIPISHVILSYYSKGINSAIILISQQNSMEVISVLFLTQSHIVYGCENIIYSSIHLV